MSTPSPSTRHPPPSGRGHGGKRPGAGAPKGNFNGFKHGGYSRRYRMLIEALMASPDAAAAMRVLAEAFAPRSAADSRSPARLRPGLRLKGGPHRSNQRKGRKANL